MRGLLANLTDVRPGEGSAVLKTGAILFCIIAGHTLTETARDALFLGELPAEWLAVVYGVLALGAGLASRLSLRVVGRFGKRNGLQATLLVAAYGVAMFYLFPKTRAAVFGLYVFSGLVSGVAVVQFWTLASHWFTVAEGRRLFGAISAGGVLGAVCGAGLAMAVLPATSVEMLLMMAVGAYLLAAYLLTGVQTEDEVIERSGTPISAVGSAAEAWLFFKQYPYAGRLAALLAVSTAALLVTDYLFKSVASRAFGAEQLPGFFATYYAVLNGFALLVQLVLSGYLVRRVGVLSAAMVLPLLLIGGAAATILSGGVLVVVLLTKAADGGLRHSLHRVTSELLWMPLPDAQRTGAKTFIDTLLVRVAQALTAAVLLALAAEGFDDPRTLGGVMAVLAMVWLGLGMGIRRPYLELFRDSLVTRPDVNHKALDLESIEYVISVLSSRDAARANAAMELLVNNGRQRLIPALVLYHDQPQVLLRGLEVITTPDRKDWIPLARRLLDHDDVDVGVGAMRALSKVGLLDAAEERLYDIRPEVRGHAAFLVEQGDRFDDPRTHPAVMELDALEPVAKRQAQLGLLSAVRNAADPRYAELLLELAGAPDDAVSEAAVLAMASTKDERFIPILIERLAIRRGRAHVEQALVAHGKPALQSLREMLRDNNTPTRLRRHLPAAIAAFGNQRAASTLLAQLSGEKVGMVRYKVIKALGRMAASAEVRFDRMPIETLLERELIESLQMLALSHQLEVVEVEGGPGLVLPLLVKLLREKEEQARDRAFRLLQLLNRSEDIRVVVLALRSEDRRVRARALEFVDTLTLQSGIARIRRLFGLLLDELPRDEVLRRARDELTELPQGAEAALLALLESTDATLATLAAYHVMERRVSALTDRVDGLVNRAESPLLDVGVLRQFKELVPA